MASKRHTSDAKNICLEHDLSQKDDMKALKLFLTLNRQVLEFVLFGSTFLKNIYFKFFAKGSMFFYFLFCLFKFVLFVNAFLKINIYFKSFAKVSFFARRSMFF